jgi:cellulose synthase/poly-beta-1,6-N-acetylglucosamine synthase-like glycosyltransferase
MDTHVSERKTQMAVPSEECLEDTVDSPSRYTQESSIELKLAKAWNKEQCHKEPPTSKTIGSLVFNSFLNTPPSSFDRSLDQYLSIELHTEEEESDLLNEDDYIGGNKYGEYTVKMFSKRALFSSLAVITCAVLLVFGNYILTEAGFVDWVDEYRVIVWVVLGYHALTIFALFCEAMGEIICCPCSNKQYVKQNEGVSILIAAFFPNEKHIIKDTLLNVIKDVDCDRNVNITLVYNTPAQVCPEETEILRFHKKTINNRKIYVIKNEMSTSKSENLNFGLAYLNKKKDLQDYTYIIDADHHPDRNCLQRLIQTLESNPKIDCVHGTTYIRNRENSGHCCLARLVDAEFFYFYNVLFPGLRTITGNAFFGGSNGIWRTQSLARFDHKMLTEDIDISIRSLINHKKIIPEYRARSGELIPKGPIALYKQRVRWAIGWNEVTYKYFTQFCCLECGNLSIRRYLGLLFILIFRYFALIFFVITVSVGHFGIFEHELVVKVNLYCFLAYTVITGLLVSLRFPQSIKNSNISIFTTIDQCFWLLLFFVLIPFYIMWNTLLEIVSIVKIISRKESKWEITVRSTTEVEVDEG